MLCQVCDSKVALKITHTYVAGRAGKTSTAKCLDCGRRYTIVALIVGQVTPGLGAYAIAQHLQRTDDGNSEAK